MTTWAADLPQTAAERALAVVPICGKIVGYLDRQDLVRAMRVSGDTFDCAARRLYNQVSWNNLSQTVRLSRDSGRAAVYRAAVLEVHKFGHDPWAGFEVRNAVEDLPNLRALLYRRTRRDWPGDSLRVISHPARTPADAVRGVARPAYQVALHHRPVLFLKDKDSPMTGSAPESSEIEAMEVDRGALDQRDAVPDTWDVAEVVQLYIDDEVPAHTLLAAWLAGVGPLRGPLDALTFGHWIEAGHLTRLLGQLSAARPLGVPKRLHMPVLMGSLGDLAALARSCQGLTTTLDLFPVCLPSPTPVERLALTFDDIMSADQDFWQGLSELSILAVLVKDTRLSHLPRRFPSTADLVEKAKSLDCVWPNVPAFPPDQADGTLRCQKVKLTTLTIGILWEKRQIDTARGEEQESQRREREIFVSLLTPPVRLIQHLVRQVGIQCTIEIQLVPYPRGSDHPQAIQDGVNKAFHEVSRQLGELQLE